MPDRSLNVTRVPFLPERLEVAVEQSEGQASTIEHLIMPAKFDLPDQIPRVLARDDAAEVRTPSEVLRELRLAAALFLFERHRVSGGRASELAGISRAEFIDACGANDIVTVDYNPTELDEELRVLQGLKE